MAKDHTLSIESALLCLNAGAYALDKMDEDALRDALADAADVLTMAIDNKDIVLGDKHKRLIEKANKYAEQLD